MSTTRAKRCKKSVTPVTPSPPEEPSLRARSCKKLLTSLTPSTLVAPSPSERPNLFPSIEEKQWIQLLPTSVWGNILELLGQTHPETVAYFGMCSSQTYLIMHSMAKKLPLRKYFCKVPSFAVSGKLLDSIKKWWKNHQNIHAGCMLGTYEGFYTQLPMDGMVQLNQVILEHNDKLAIYIANILFRIRECFNPPRQNFSVFLQPGGERSLESSRADLKRMLLASVCCPSRGREDYTTCKLNGAGHSRNEMDFYNYIGVVTCNSCYCDRETQHFTSID